MLRHVAMDVIKLLESSASNIMKLTFEATVATGFESVALEEFKEKFGSSEESCHSRGRIFFNIDRNKVPLVQELRSVDNIFVLAYGVMPVNYNNNICDDLELIKTHAAKAPWEKVLSVWSSMYKFPGIMFPTRELYSKGLQQEEHIKELTKIIIGDEIIDTSLFDDDVIDLKYNFMREKLKVVGNNEIITDKSNHALKRVEQAVRNKLDKRAGEQKVLKYRVTCYRSGSHSFGSQDAAHHFGGVLQDKFNWIVDLSVHDMEIVLTIKDDLLYCGIALTTESKHHRNISHFGPTTLRATICYNMLRLGTPAVGDIVIDPLCGGGSISIEGCLAYRGTYHLCGDVHLKAIARTNKNIEGLEKKASFIELMMWNAKRLPLLDSCVDLFVTDLPFGKRSGNKHDNRTLYRDVLLELGRVVKPSGRAVLLTQDRNSINVAFSQACGLWKVVRVLRANIGGLDAAVYVLRREPSIYYSDILISKRRRKKKSNKGAVKTSNPTESISK